MKNNRKKSLTTFFAILLIIVGIVFLLYPIVSSYFSKNMQLGVVTEYQEQIENEDSENLKLHYEKAKEYNKKVSTLIQSMDPMIVKKDEEEKLHDYFDILNFNDVMAYLDIPKIDVKLPIYHGTSEEVLQKGVGHLQNSGFPIGGIGTHSLLTGHTALPNSEILSRLDEIKIGDKFYISILDSIIAYEVNQIKVVEPHVIDDVRIDENKDYVTLITCTPYGINTHRLLVRGSRVEYNNELEDLTLSNNNDDNLMDITNNNFKIIICLTLIILILLLILRRIYLKYKMR